MDTDTDTEPHPQPDQPDQPDAPYIDSVSNLIVHTGDILVSDPFRGGRYEYRLFDQGRAHYATLVGHHNDDGHFVVDAIQYLGPSTRRELLPLRAVPDAEPVTLDGEVVDFTVPLPGHESHTLTVVPDKYTYIGDPPPPRPPATTYRHRHFHPHTRDDDVLRGAYAHAHWHTHPYPRGAVDAHGRPPFHGPSEDGDAAIHDHPHDAP